MMKYDDVETYYLNCETDFPDADRASGTHIGFYLAWIVNNGMGSGQLNAHAESVRQRITDGCALLFDQCDGKLMSGDLSERGNEFTRSYYPHGYFSDYEQVFAIDAEAPDAFIKVENTWSNYEKVERLLDTRFREWQATVALPDKAALMRRMEAVFLPLLEQMGFVCNPNEFSQATYEISAFTKRGAWGEHRMALRAVDERPQFYGMVVEVSSTLNELAQAFYDDMVIDNPRQSRVLPATFHTTMLNWLGNWPVPLHSMYGGALTAIPITDSSQIQPAITLMGERAANKLPDLFQSLETLAGYSKLYCTEPLSASPYFWGYTFSGPLLCAELASNPRLSAICDEIEQGLAITPAQASSNDELYVLQMRRRLQRIREKLSAKRSGMH